MRSTNINLVLHDYIYDNIQVDDLHSLVYLQVGPNQSIRKKDIELWHILKLKNS